LDGRKGIPFSREVRLGYLGVPPITPEILSRVEGLGARFVFHEVARQFSMPDPARDIVEQYLHYTYPYSLHARSEDINRESGKRSLDGLVHYVQSFCHRNLEDVVFTRALSAPLLTVECDCPGELGAAATSRLESFIQVIGENL
jgi:benzoyl-CoA reductase/2-hydroxyglutaryl-CoA dehydratase subunit BcrC/BadD/HgdB